MLKLRVITAVLLLVVLGATFTVQSAWPFLIFLSIACGCAAWEWSRLTWPGFPFFSALLGTGLFILTVFQAGLWLSEPQPNMLWLIGTTLLSTVIWFFAVIPAVLHGRSDAPARSIFWTAFAPVTLFATWASLAALYIDRGALYVLSLLIFIWIADIAAYFAGKAWGKHKLAPSISPGKTIEGALAGLTGVVIWALASALWPGSFAAVLVERWSWAGAIICALLLGVLSIIGDLFESLLKRRAGVKDSSALLPGHGGVYDRIDAVVAVVPVACVMTEIFSGPLTW